MTALDRVADEHAAAQLAAANIHLTAELERTRNRLDSAVEATGRALRAAQRGNKVAQAVIQQRAALLRWQREDTPITRTALNIARLNVEAAVEAWLEGQK